MWSLSSFRIVSKNLYLSFLEELHADTWCLDLWHLNQIFRNQKELVGEARDSFMSLVATISEIVPLSLERKLYCMQDRKLRIGSHN